MISMHLMNVVMASLLFVMPGMSLVESSDFSHSSIGQQGILSIGDNLRFCTIRKVGESVCLVTCSFTHIKRSVKAINKYSKNDSKQPVPQPSNPEISFKTPP